uniref:Conserved hypothetical plastid protein n=1 Tax=Corallina ferreyrae TaxID=2547422 RepID=A0A482CJX7_9FLOR|nr:conserved hypothetical plastid protein [Corallina ferreyrae]QBL75591.1 conserved hypothetical plastid protein [Corallina ferreyrae]
MKRLWFQSLKLLESVKEVDLEYRHQYFNTVGFIYYNMKDYDLAKKYYIEAISIKNNYLVALQNLAKVYELQNNYVSAIESYNSILSYEPDNRIANLKVTRLKNRDSRI